MKIIEKIYDITTNEETIVDREMTDSELAAYEIENELLTTAITAEAAKAAEKEALLARLGITADEAKLLLG